MNIKLNINTLGIPKSHKCPNCGKSEKLNIDERRNLADCMINNCVGLWALLHCGNCGFVDTIYPIRINGVECTPHECDKLISEIEKYEIEKSGSYVPDSTKK